MHRDRVARAPILARCWISRRRVAKKGRGSDAPMAKPKCCKRVAAKSQTFAGRRDHDVRSAKFFNHLATKMARIVRSFFARSVHAVAPDLIGATFLFNGVGG